MNSQASLTDQLTTLADRAEEDDLPETAKWLRNVVYVVRAAWGVIPLPKNEDARDCIKIANDHGLYDAADWITNRLAGESK